MYNFSEQIQNWYHNNKRDLPWRKTKNPYHIWLSEIILQQTRVQQGTSYYHKFIDHFQDIRALAGASEEEVLNLWQGLGYYSRGRNLHKAAQMLVEKFNANFPSNFEDILKLPGVGNYTAAAIASFAYNLPHAVVDGNVYRVLSRYLNTSEYIDTPQGQKYYQQIADELLDPINPAVHNQAIMELGALICTPRNPNCEHCPLSNSCEARANNTWKDLPRKKGKVKVRSREFHYFVCIENDKILLQKRGEKDIWANMYEFPMLEGALYIKEIINHVKLLKTMQHKLTHQNLEVHFYSVKNELDLYISHQAQWMDIEELKNLPLPRVIDRFLEDVYALISK